MKKSYFGSSDVKVFVFYGNMSARVYLVRMSASFSLISRTIGTISKYLPMYVRGFTNCILRDSSISKTFCVPP